MRYQGTGCSLAAESLAILQQEEEEDPEQAHGVPVPDGGVDHDLSRGE